MKPHSFLKLTAMATIVLCAACSPHPKADAPIQPASLYPQTIDEAVSSSRRDSEDRQRDQYRHPVQTLKFFGLQPEMTVVEIWPSGGWYTQIIAPYLAQKGHYIGANHGPASENDSDLAKWLKTNKDVAGQVQITEFSPEKTLAVAPANSADMVLTFRNVHNWMKGHNEKQAFKTFFKALKPGGILGVVEHRADTIHKQDPSAVSGYVREDYVIKLAEKAGFKLAAKSEINANPKDTKDYENGVWTLPPNYALGDKDEAKYEAIGESDRMTLKFVKPLKK